MTCSAWTNRGQAGPEEIKCPLAAKKAIIADISELTKSAFPAGTRFGKDAVGKVGAGVRRVDGRPSVFIRRVTTIRRNLPIDVTSTVPCSKLSTQNAW